MKNIIANQFRQPKGFLGFFIARIMEKFNSENYTWMIKILALKNKGEQLLEIGYGTGKAINIIAKQNSAVQITGIDFSKLMYKKALRKNNEFIRQGRVRLFYGDFLQHDFNNVKFDKIYAINVIYFCKDLDVFFSGLRKLLNPDGKIYIYMADQKAMTRRKFTQTEVFEKYNLEYVLEALNKSGFSDIKYEISTSVFEKAYCFIARL